MAVLTAADDWWHLFVVIGADDEQEEINNCFSKAQLPDRVKG